MGMVDLPDHIFTYINHKKPTTQMKVNIPYMDPMGTVETSGSVCVE